MAATNQLRRIKNWSAEYRSNDIVCFQTFFELKTTNLLQAQQNEASSKVCMVAKTKTYID